MGWENVDLPAIKIIFQSGEMRCSNETAFIVNGQPKKSKDLIAGDQIGINVVKSVINDGQMSYFMDVK